MNNTIACGTLLYRKSHKGGYDILLVRPHHNRDVWGIPKGHIEHGETLTQCATRETVEETGLTPIVGMQLHDVKTKNKFEIKTVKTFLATVNYNTPFKQRDNENHSVRWFHYEELPLIHKYQISLLYSAINILKKE